MASIKVKDVEIIYDDEKNINDIKNDELPIQKRLSSILGDEITIDGSKVKINEYLLSSFEEEIKEKVTLLLILNIVELHFTMT